MSRKVVLLILLVSTFLCFLGLLPQRAALGQAASSVLLGTVSDETGAVLPGVMLKVKNVNTGISNTLITDDSGSYRVPGLIPGEYEIQAELSGFKTEVYTGIKLAVGQQAVINLTLRVGEITEKVVVVGEAPMLEATTSTISGLVDDKKIRDLPLNGRDFFQLTFLQTGVMQATLIGGSNPWGNSSHMKLAVNGMRPTQNNLLIDGTDANDPTYNISPGGASGGALGVEAIREFRIMTNAYSAEFGRNAGSIITTVSQSGTNEFHGSFYEFHRNSALDARNFFDLAREARRARGEPEIPSFVRNQFGGTFGGPLKKDRTFFFLNYEGLRERFGQTATATVPNADAHRGILPLPDPRDPTRRIPTEVGVDPKIRPYLALYPLPNGPDLGDGTAIWTGSGTRITDENYFMVRIDHKLSDKDNFFARYTFDDSFTIPAFISTFVPGFPGRTDRRNQWVTLQEQKIIRPNLLNEFRFGFNRTMYVASAANQHPNLVISLVPGEKTLGTISIAGLNRLGHNTLFPFGGTSNTFQYIDNVSYTRGRHSIKFGADIRRMQMNGGFGEGNGSYSFDNLRDFLQARPFSFFGGLPEAPDTNRSYRQTQYNLFVQDDIKISRNFTLNLGLRYELFTNPTDDTNRLVNIRDPFKDTNVTLGPPLFIYPKDAFQPRFGFAWSPFGNEKTVVRAGFGIFHDQLWMNLWGNTRFLPPFTKRTVIIGPRFLDPLAGLAITPPLGGTAMTFRPDVPYAMQYNLQVQRQILSDTILKVGYVGSRGVHLVSTASVNLRRFELLSDGRIRHIAGAPRINPNFGSVSQVLTNFQSFYNSLQISAERRLSRGLQYQASYTFSRSIDDISGPYSSDFNNDPGTPQNPFDRKGDRGLSSFNVNHALVINYTYDLPFGPGKPFGGGLTGAAGKLIEGWQLSGITTFYTGYPFTIRNGFDRALALGNHNRPNLKPGAKERILGTVERWFDPSVYELQPIGTYGNVGRNTLIGPGFNNFDFTLTKSIALAEDKSIQFRVEFFNIFNHPNFEPPLNTQDAIGTGGDGQVVFASPDGRPVGNAGRIFRTVSTSRQLQFGLKFVF